MRGTAPRLLLLILLVHGPAAAQVAMPDGVALAPFPVSAPTVFAFPDTEGGTWSFFLGAQAGSPLYAQHVNSDGSYAPGFNSQARALTRANTFVNSIWAAPDGVSGATVCWFGVNPRDTTSQFVALRLLRFDAHGDIPTAFPDTGIVVSSEATAAMVVGDGLGGCYVAWEELKSASNPDIVAQHYNDFGVRQWTPAGSPTGRNVCATVGIQRLRSMQPDGNGGAYVVWADSRSPTTVPLYTTRLLPAGVAGSPWITNGVRVTPVASGIRLVGSGVTANGGLLLAWRDINVLSQFVGQAVDPNAGFLWGANGAVVANVTPTHAEFVPAGNGDVFVTWGGTDISCSRLAADGTKLWPEPAGRQIVAVSTGNVHAVSDGAGGQKVAWSWDNSGQTDVNVIHVNGAAAPYAGEPPAGDPFEATLLPEEPVAWFNAQTSTPNVEWLRDGILRLRRIADGTTDVAPGAPASGIVLAPPSPNPWRAGSLSLRFTAPRGPVRLDLYDAAGRCVVTRALYSEGRGQELRIEDAGLPAGVYSLRLATVGGTGSRQVVRVN